jgi:hypothetical protein
VEAKSWQAVYATLLLERSKFGLNELLGGIPAIHEDKGCRRQNNTHEARSPVHWRSRPLIQDHDHNANDQKNPTQGTMSAIPGAWVFESSWRNKAEPTVWWNSLKNE